MAENVKTMQAKVPMEQKENVIRKEESGLPLYLQRNEEFLLKHGWRKVAQDELTGQSSWTDAISMHPREPAKKIQGYLNETVDGITTTVPIIQTVGDPVPWT